jgi:hypothetical protein
MMAGCPIFTSNFAILDVERNRHALERYVKKHGPVRLIVTMDLIYPAGNDDGTSIEFCASVQAIEIQEPHNV